MNRPHETLPDGVSITEDLAAYLDGELDAESRRRVEKQLSMSDELRNRLKEYQQTWDLLDDLPRASVDGSFTRTTVEMVAVRAEDEVVQTQQSKRRRRVLLWCLGIAGMMVSGAAGYLVSHRQLSAPNEQIVEELPIIEHLDAYQNAGTIEFLRQLDEHNLFQENGYGM